MYSATSIGSTLDAQISNTLEHLTIVAVMISGALCILRAAILLLHQWFPWWQAFGIAGVATRFVGIASHAIIKRSTEVKNAPA